MANEKTDEGMKRVVGFSEFAHSIENGVINSGIFALCPGDEWAKNLNEYER